MKVQRLTNLDSLAQRRYVECIKSGIQFYYDKINSCFAYLYVKNLMVEGIRKGLNSEYYAIIEVYNDKAEVTVSFLVPIQVKQFMEWIEVVKQVIPELISI